MSIIIGILSVGVVLYFIIDAIKEGHDGIKGGYGKEEVPEGHVSFTHSYRSQFWTNLFFLIFLIGFFIFIIGNK